MVLPLVFLDMMKSLTLFTREVLLRAPAMMNMADICAGEIAIGLIEVQYSYQTKERGAEHTYEAKVSLAAQEHDDNYDQCPQGQHKFSTHNLSPSAEI